MDFVSLSPSDDDLFHRDQDHNSPEADITSVPETPTPVAQTMSKTQATSKTTNSVLSMVRIPPGSSLLNLQGYRTSPDESSVSPSPPHAAAKRGRGNSRTERRHRWNSPTPSPPKITPASRRSPDHTNRPTRRSQHHHAPARSPDQPLYSNISDWKVATLQKALKDKGIKFHRNRQS